MGIHDHMTDMAGRSVGLITGALESIKGDPAGLDRLALASTFALGESPWVWEVIFRLMASGVPGDSIEREVPVATGRRDRFDLRVYQTTVEFESAFSHFFLNNPETATCDWFRKDWEKLRTTNGGGLFVLTLATTVGFTHRRWAISRGG